MSTLTGSSPSDSLLDSMRQDVESALNALEFPDQPSSLYDPIRYVLEGGGKRLRPILVLLAAEAFGANRQRAIPAALAVEVFHNFTLVHDDIMDHSNTRRGRETVHVKWDEPTAILSGDYLMALSYRLLSQSPVEALPELLSIFDAMVEKLCEGQALDKHFESVPTITLAEYIAMIDAKTGALLQACLEMGGLLGGASGADRAHLRETGLELGRAFQIQDDLLDLIADDHRWGKLIGGDLMEGKKTFLLVRALERAEGPDRSLFEGIVSDGGLPPAQVSHAREIMDRIGILDEARAGVSLHTERALELVGELPVTGEASEALKGLIQGLGARLH